MQAALKVTLTLCLSTVAFTTYAQSKGPAAQYWIDLSTNHFAVPGMPDSGGMGSGMLGGLFGGGMMGGAAGGDSSKSVRSELYVRAHPSGTEGTHSIPANMNMGQSLLLTPLRTQPATHGTSYQERNEPLEKPKGRVLLYWGCGESVRAGQPKILDFSKPNAGDAAQFFSSHGTASKGAQGRPGHALWPNERDNKRVPENASLLGDHAVTGDGVPPSLKFAVDASHDFLPKVQLATKGSQKDAIQVQWNAMQNAKGYFLYAQGAAKGAGGAQDLIMWSSSEKPENGAALMDYQPPSQVAKLLQQKVVLPSSASNCTVPKGIFEKAEGAMLNMIAYGGELNVAHPARPAKAPADWQPEWTARVRIKSTGMAMLGMDSAADTSRNMQDTSDNGSRADATPTSLPNVPNPVNLLRGLFGN